jgi:TatD DNase family protein
VLPTVGLEHLVLETDCPYLAPVPYRGKRNEPSYMPLVAHRMSEIMKIPVEQIQATTTANALKLFHPV